MIQTDNLILGAGISGLGAAYALRQTGREAVIVEKDATYGGLCGNVEMQGFRFDRFVHLSFATDERVNALFRQSCGDLIKHTPNPYNIYKGIWIKHPAQNNLFPLEEEEKKLLIQDFMNRPSIEGAHPANYEEWLRLQFGHSFAERFPMPYTRKYWMHEARDLRTEWVGQRIYQPSVEEVIAGSQTADTPVTYYAKEMRYPKRGGYKALLRTMAEAADLRYGMEVVGIDPQKRMVRFANGESVAYGRLFSSLPLPVVVKCLPDAPQEVREAAGKLEATSGYHVSIALKTKNIPPYLWWYIYDEDILAARVYSPSLKSPDNAPEGCSSLQMEVYCAKDAYTEEELWAGTVGRLLERGIIREEDILFTHIGFEPFANVIFTEPIYEARQVVRDYLAAQGIVTFGRFGCWEYLWSDQSLMSGLDILNA